MTALGRPRIYATNADRQRAYRRKMAHPTLRHVVAPQTPGCYTEHLDDLLRTGQRYGTIYADPPWPYSDQPPSGGAAKHYATMPLDAICALPVRDLAADQAHLHLWVTNAFLFDAAQIFAAWGFTYKTNLVWVKPRVMGPGHYWRNCHELLLFGVRGGLTARQKNLRSWLEPSRQGHSEKPERVRDLVEQLSPGPYLELFGRHAVPNWTVFGNEQLPRTGRLFQDRTG
jgi:N6-adenosine-specific RNA methylase IME4